MPPLTEERVRQLLREEIIAVLGDVSRFPFEVDGAIRARGFLNTFDLTGIVKATAGRLSAVVPIAGPTNFFAANTSGGSPTHRVDVNDGIITNIL